MNDHYIRHSERVDKLQSNRSPVSDGRLNGCAVADNRRGANVAAMDSPNCCAQSVSLSVSLSGSESFVS